MRVPMLVVAMIATPLFAVAAQGQSTGDHVNNRFKVCEKLSKANNKQGSDVAGNSAKPRREPKKCVPLDPPPVTPPASGIAEVHGLAFNDVNANGVFDLGETPLAGWPIQLAGPVSSMVTTASDGTYSFVALPVGVYTVCAAAGKAQAAPVGGPTCPSGASGYAVEVPSYLPSVWYLDIDFALH